MKLPVGLTGGIASGKSTVAEIFDGCGALIISGDSVAADVMIPGSDALEDLVRSFGPAVLHADGTLNRRFMLDILRSRPEKFQEQLRVLTPHIIPEVDRQVKTAMKDHPQKIIIVEAPLLFEYDQISRYSPIIVVFIPRELQITRLMSRSGGDRVWAGSVVDIQIPTGEKCNSADFIVDNSGSIENTRKQVVEIYQQLMH